MGVGGARVTGRVTVVAGEAGCKSVARCLMLEVRAPHIQMKGNFAIFTLLV